MANDPVKPIDDASLKHDALEILVAAVLALLGASLEADETSPSLGVGKE